MSQRFLLRIDRLVTDAWSIRVFRPDGSELILAGTVPGMQRVTLPKPVPPDTPAVLPWPLSPVAPAVADVQAMAARCRRLVQRQPQAGDVEDVGRHLYFCLLGNGLWDAIRADAGNTWLVELALALSRDESDLLRLNWELMHTPTGDFLAAGLRAVGAASPTTAPALRVAVTRVVADAPPLSFTTPELPRMLFIVGCSLTDPNIKPGAEFFSLLRRLEARDPVGVARRRTLPIQLLLEATPSQVREKMAEFRPHIVHLVCHGEAVPGAPVRLILQPEPDAPAAPKLDAERFAELLTVPAADPTDPAFRPSCVILTACFSGVAGAVAVGGPAQAAPFAAELVFRGIPIVLGMAGEVADEACRLFTRAFDEAIVFGKPPVQAIEYGRRAAFLESNWPRRSVDWALPTLYFAPGVDPNMPLTLPNESAVEEARLDNLRAALGLEVRGEPVLAARFEVLDRHYRRLFLPQPGVLALVGPLGSGKSRLLRELAEQALFAGHLPVLISHQGRYPSEAESVLALRNRESIGQQWEDVVSTTYSHLGLDPPAASQLLQLGRAFKGEQPAELKTVIRNALANYTDGAKALQLALQADLLELQRQARAAGQLHATHGRVILFMDHLERYQHELVTKFLAFESAFSQLGLGTPVTGAIPVVIALQTDSAQSLILKPTVEKPPLWMHKVLLTRFSSDGEDLQAYARVLLHPFDPNLCLHTTRPFSISGTAWVVVPEANPAKWAQQVAKLRNRLKLQPIDFLGPELFRWVEDTNDLELNLVKVANDEDRLKSLPR